MFKDYIISIDYYIMFIRISTKYRTTFVYTPQRDDIKCKLIYHRIIAVVALLFQCEHTYLCFFDCKSLIHFDAAVFSLASLQHLQMRAAKLKYQSENQTRESNLL